MTILPKWGGGNNHHTIIFVLKNQIDDLPIHIALISLFFPLKILNFFWTDGQTDIVPLLEEKLYENLV